MGGDQDYRLSPVDTFSEEQSRYELHDADTDGSKPADHERHHLLRVNYLPRGSGKPRYGYQTLRSVVSTRLRSSYSKTGPPPLIPFFR